RSEGWLNITLEVIVESYSIRMLDIPWSRPSEVVHETGGKRYWAVENQTYISIINDDISPYVKDPISASQKIGSWILDRLKYEVTSRKGAERALLLDGGNLVLRGDCEEVADVFVTMARALGIHARVVHGMLLVSSDERMWAIRKGSEFETSDNWGGHAWPQIYVYPAGWVDVEMLEGMVVKIGDFSGRHIKYNFEEKKFMGSTIDNYCLTGYFEVMAIYFSFRKV
ncbi:MAG: transglutaminase-like domain-containing protein, partial [Candidatus Bathyarchaeia archaeon]